MRKRSKAAKKKHTKQMRKRLSLVDYSTEYIEIDGIEMPWIVRSVTPQEDYTLLLRFDDGKIGVYNMWPMIQQEDGGDDVFVPLEDIALFMKAHIDGDSVAWNDDIDIAPEELYANCMSLPEYEEWAAECEDKDEEAYLDYYLSRDNIPIPDKVFDILNRRLVDCLKANNIPIPESLKGVR